MMNEIGFRRIPPDQLSGSVHTVGTQRHPSVIDPIPSKRVCFYKSGDPQFNGLRMVINNRTFKTFDALLDSLSKKVPLPFGVRNITTPRGVHAVYTLDELEDGKSYICSDSRKVKPINLALARKKLPPWYHARPASSRRRTVQQARFFPGRNINGPEQVVVVRTPKRLLVFRNGEPSIRHTVLLQKRTTPTFESILGYISGLMEVRVVKLYTPDGRRVDGLPGLILCSGTVVAAGREPFRSANYDAQKSPAPSRLHANRLVPKRLKTLNRKKKLLSYSPKSRNFSPASERYIVSRIHNSIAGSSCELPSNPSNSMELESSRLLGSVAETEHDTCLSDGTGEGMPTEDDIEKSFRVNQDGSMTVEMKVRLTIKEEEIVHWTTTLTRSSVANQLNASSLLVSEPEKCSPESNSLDLQSPAASTDTINRNETKDNNDEDPPSMGSAAFSENSNEEVDIKVPMDVLSPWRAPTPGHKQLTRRQSSLDSLKSVMAERVQQTHNRAMTEQYRMVKQSGTRPVPKPRRLGSVDAKTINSRNVSTFNSASMTEIMQVDSAKEEVTETVVRIYEQQTYQDNFLSNFYTHEASTSGISYSRPATTETGRLSSSNEFEPELWRPSTASEAMSIWRAESMSVMSDLTVPSFKTGAIQATNRKLHFSKATYGKEKPEHRDVNKDKMLSSKPKVINKRVHRLMSPGKRRNKTPAEATEKQKKVKTFSSAGFIKRIYGNKSKPAKTIMKPKRRSIQNSDGGDTTKSSKSSGETIKDLTIPSPQKINISKTVTPETSRLKVSLTEVNQPRATLQRQTSMHPEKNNKNESYDVSESMSMPAFNSSSSVTNEYVENWLEKADLNPTDDSDVESKSLEAVIHEKTENDMFGESESDCGLTTVAEEVKCCEKSEMQTPLPENVQVNSVKQRIQSFENKSGSSVETTTAMQQIAHGHATSTNTDNCNRYEVNNTEEIKPNSEGSEINPLTSLSSTETPPGSEVENESEPIKISLQKATPYSTLSMELPPPPPAESLSNVGQCMVDVPSETSSPLYRLSSASSQTSDNHPLSISSTSDKAESPTDHTMGGTTSIQTDNPLTQGEAQLQKPIKRAPLVSNVSLERKMSLRRACVDKYTLCSDANSETSTSSAPINTVGDNVLPNDHCSTQHEETQQSMKSPSCGSSVSPISVTSEGKISDSISSGEDLTPSNLPFKETKEIKTSSLSPTSSPKALMKKVKLMSSPSPERKPQTKKHSSELPNNSPKQSLRNQVLDKTTSPNTGARKQAALHTSPSPERKQKLNTSNLQKKPSPYSQTLDVASPPVKHKSNKKQLSRNLSSETVSESPNKTQSPSDSEYQQSIKSTSEMDERSETSDQSDENKVNETDDLRKAYQDKSIDTHIMPQPLNISNQPNMKPVLEKICYSIKSIRQITQNKRQSCLEKSNSLPDFSSHVASTFGSSSKALLAFLAVMTLKEGITNLNGDELNVNNVSCAEALKMIDSLREIANIEDSHKLKTSLSDLQKSASKQLLESWRGFQEISDKCKSRSSTPNCSEQEFISEASSEQGLEEYVIDEMMSGLDIPETLKEELASLSADIESESDNEGKTSADEAVNVKDVTQVDEAKVDISPNLKNFTNINQLKQSNVEIASQKTNLKQVSTDQATEDDDDDQHGQNCAAKYPQPVEHNIEQSSEERQLNSQVSFEEDVEDEENQEQDTLSQEKANMSGAESCSSKEEEQDKECRQSEESVCIPESGTDDEGQRMSSANKDLEQKVSCEESVSNSEAGEQQSSEEESEVQCEERKQESRESDLSDPEPHFEPPSTDYVKLNASSKGSNLSPDCENQSLSEEEQAEVQRACNSDVDEPSSSEAEQSEVERKELNAIVEENLSEPEEEHESEEEHLDDQQDEQMKEFKETDEDKVSSEDEDIHADNIISNVIESQDSPIIKDSLIEESDTLEKHDSFNVEEDSGNDHSSCEEHGEIEPTKVKQISSSTEEELSCYDKGLSSAEEHANIDRNIEESCVDYQEAPVIAKSPEDTKPEKAIVSKLVAEKVSFLEKKSAQKITIVSQKNVPLVTDVEESPSESPTSEPAVSAQPVPQSSLSFSYDCSGVITTEPEGSRVKSIREMFLAKSSTDTQQGQRRLPSSNRSERVELRAETSTSGGYQSQTSSELSSGEDDSSRTTISKGFVRRTIERLYGKKDVTPEEVESERPPSAPKQKKKEQPNIFSPFHMARSKAMSELSYFNSTNALDTLSEATRCIAFNAQVGPGDSVPIDKGRWLLNESTLMRKSVSDPVGISKNCPKDEGVCEDTAESTPYSLFNTKSEVEDTKKSFSTKCTYFSLPHASDSEVCQEELSTASKGSLNGDSITETKDNSEDTKTWAEKNGTLPIVSITDFKMKDNKVHPVTDNAVVAVQPKKGQTVVNRRPQEPDVLDIVYNFCGQNCPIL